MLNREQGPYPKRRMKWKVDLGGGGEVKKEMGVQERSERRKRGRGGRKREGREGRK